MRPNAERRPPGQESGAQQITRGDGDKARVNHGTVSPPARRWTGCPCGCMTKPPWLDDPACVRHRPVGEPRDWGTYDVEALGLVSHDRGDCARCQAVGV